MVAAMAQDNEHMAGELPQRGTIASVDYDAKTCIVTIGDLTTGELPWFAAHAGGVSIWCPPKIAPTLASIDRPSISQSRESDVAFLRWLGREHDAVATIKENWLIFSPKGAGVTARGQRLPNLTVTRASGERHSWARQKRDGQEGVSAS